jgi:hypothetical protein
MPGPNNAFAYSSYALLNIEKLSITQDVTRHSIDSEERSGVFLLQPRGATVPLPEKSVVLVVEENAVFRSANAKELILKSTTVDALFAPVRRG